METILKEHNPIELPQEVCRKLELIPGARFDIEVEANTGEIILQPVTKKMRQIRSEPENPSPQTEATRKIKSASGQGWRIAIDLILTD